MSDNNAKVLPEGEFFMLVDNRAEAQLLAGDPGKQFDNEPGQTKARSLARFRRLQELYSNRSRTGHFPSLFEDMSASFDPAWLSNISYFERSIPNHLSHFDTITDFAREPEIDEAGAMHRWPGAFWVVSEDWKSAIESVEPSVHEFFPHRLRFARGIFSDRYIFRERQELDFIDYESSMIGGSIRMFTHEGGGRSFNIKPGETEGLVARRKSVAGRHWMRQVREGRHFVSRALAEKLFPLLPRSTRFSRVVLSTITLRLSP